MKPFRRILIPTDFSAAAEGAIALAADTADSDTSEMTLLHVIMPPPDPASSLLLSTFEGEIATLEHNAAERLEALRQRYLAEFRHVRCQVRIGRPAEEILAAAESMPADLIAISTHGYSGLRRLMMGSTAERVVRTAPMPVLSVRHSS